MKAKLSAFSLILVVWLATSLACSLAGGAPQNPASPSGDDSQDAIATAVAATLAAESAPASDAPTETTQAALPPQPNFNSNGVSFFFDSQLADDVTVATVPANLNPDMPMWNTPAYRKFSFTNWTLEGGYLPAAIHVFPVADFQAANPAIAERLAALQAALAAQPADGTGLDVPSLMGAGQHFQSNIKFLDFQNGSGARWLSQYGQAVFPVGFPQLFYTYQGFSEDGSFYISLILPVNHTVLPPAESVTLDEAFFNNYESYAAENKALLTSQADASFTPSLELLDQLVGSLLVGTP